MTTLDGMWQRLTEHQPYADKYGYGADWMIMCKTRKPEAAWDAARDAWTAWAAWADIRPREDGVMGIAEAARAAERTWDASRVQGFTESAATAIEYIERAEQLLGDTK